jgi:tRNA nucleotidyltransferase (CCA-adding enzyme)
MARRAHVYPQIRLTAADLVDAGVVVATPGMAAGDAVRLARRRHAAVVACAGAGHALAADLARAVALGLADLPAAMLTRPLPVVEPGESEVTVRRRLAAGAPALVVGGGPAPRGVVSRGPAPVPASMRGRLGRALDPETQRVLDLVGHVAAACGARAFAVGGLVRDVWLGRARSGRDLDVVVEGDGLDVARALATELGGIVIEHRRFLTASVEAPGRAGRVDVATSRSERYEAPGALPHVIPAGIAQDLQRRDFTVNAMAVELGPDALPLLDPLGGVHDVTARRLRILHPLSFVEDPTRIFRAARYAVRLDFALDAWTRRCRALALSLTPYPALSATRVGTEVERILAEARPDHALGRLGRAGALRLVEPRLRWTRVTAARVDALPGALAWAAARGLDVPALALAGLALAADQPERTAAGVLRGLALTGEPLARALDALAAGPPPAAPASAVVAALRRRSPLALAWLWLTGDVAVRARLDWFVEHARALAPVLRGDDVIALGVPRGPRVAAVLAALRDARADGALADREAEVEFVRAWVRHGPPAREEG